MNSDPETFVLFDYKWRGVKRLSQTVAPAQDTKFLVGLGRAFYWQSLLDTGTMASGSAIAKAERLHPSTVNELLRLTLLAPDIIEQLMVGRQPSVPDADVVSAQPAAGGLAGSARHHRQLRLGHKMAKKDKGVLTGKPVTYPIPSPAGGVQMETFIPWTLVKRGIRREIITPLDAPQAFTVEAVAERAKRKAAQNTPLIRALGLAHYWQRLLDEGKFRSITDIAAAEGIDVTQARRLLRLMLLAPAVVANLLANPDMAVNLEAVLRRVMPLDWQEQRAVFAGK